MMRINLLEESGFQTLRNPESGFVLPQLRAAGNLPPVMLSAGLVIAVGVGAIWGMLLIKDRADLDARIEVARIEQARLAHVLERAEDRRGTREELSRRIGVIIKLRRMQDLPVHLLELMSTSLANFVWLEEATSTGELVILRGRARTPLAVANFLRNLEESTDFADVAMGSLQNEEASGLTKFEVTMTFKPGRSLRDAAMSGFRTRRRSS